MPEQIFNLAMNQGLVAVLFVYSFYYNNKKNDDREKRTEDLNMEREKRAEDREKRLLEIIDNYSEKLDKVTITLEKLCDDVDEMKHCKREGV